MIELCLSDTLWHAKWISLFRTFHAFLSHASCLAYLLDFHLHDYRDCCPYRGNMWEHYSCLNESFYLFESEIIQYNGEFPRKDSSYSYKWLGCSIIISSVISQHHNSTQTQVTSSKLRVFMYSNLEVALFVSTFPIKSIFE